MRLTTIDTYLKKGIKTYLITWQQQQGFATTTKNVYHEVMYSLQEIAHELDIPEASVRYYAKVYSEFLPKRKLPDERWAKYEPEALEIISLIRESYQKDKKRGEIKKLLKKRYSPTFDAEFPEEESNNQEMNKKSLQPLSNHQDLATMIQQLVTHSRESAELNSRYQETVSHQKELLKVKDETMRDLKDKLEKKESNEEVLQNRLKTQKGKTDKLSEELTKIKEGGLFKKIAKAMVEEEG